MLLDSQKKLVAFGHDAEDRYSQICEVNQQIAWYYLKGSNFVRTTLIIKRLESQIKKPTAITRVKYST
jgi:hypothetical protein